jgi:hypothetical protein
MPARPTLARPLLVPLLAICAAGCLGRPNAKGPADEMLALVQDEATLERKIGAYLERRDRGLRPTYREQNGDLILEFLWKFPGPSPHIYIDTWASAKNELGGATERAIQIRLVTHVVVPPPERARALLLINEHNTHYWAGTFFLNPEDAEIGATWTFNVTPNGPVHPESVYDALARITDAWRELYGKLSAQEGSGASGEAT